MAPRERLFALEQFGIKLGLDNITRLLDALKHPERSWKSVHVAGTNGKGSVTAMIERGLRSAGHRTGRYTSPHLSEIEERIAIDGEPIDAATFDDVAAQVLATADTFETPPTFFEATTAMAFEIFRRQGVTVGVIEVGLGGRFDSTNVITPEVSVITSIALDHERHLGRTLGAIAFEKAGIIKPGVPVVIGSLPAEAMEVVREVAQSQRAAIISAGPEYSYGTLRLALLGRHQEGNARVAARTLEVCCERGIDVSVADIEVALTQVEWPARLEWIRVGADQQVLLDAAHNPAGAAALAAYIRDAGLGPVPMVIAIMRDKDVGGMLRELMPVASRIVATRAASARSLSAEDLCRAVREHDKSMPCEACANADEAVARALSHSNRVVVAGSIFLVGPIRARLSGKLSR